jgi:L-serine dehydratase
MTTSRTISVFDVIGPVMVGPSSSHTAGAVKIGLVARSLLGSRPQKALIELHGSYAQTGKGHGTDKAIVAGLLGFIPSDPRIRYSFEHARERGLDFNIIETDLGEDAHVNSARLTVSSKDQTVQLIAASTGGGSIEVTEVQGYTVSFSGDLDTLLIIAKDIPGTINEVTDRLVKRNINVAYLTVGREIRGGEAIMIIETDQSIPHSLVVDISLLEWVRWTCKIDKLVD